MKAHASRREQQHEDELQRVNSDLERELRRERDAWENERRAREREFEAAHVRDAQEREERLAEARAQTSAVLDALDVCTVLVMSRSTASRRRFTYFTE